MSGPQGVQQFMGARQNAAQQYAGINRSGIGAGQLPAGQGIPTQGPLPKPFNLNLGVASNPAIGGDMNGIIGSLAQSFVNSSPQGAMNTPAARLFGTSPELQQHLQQNAYDQIYRNMYSGLLPNYESAGGGDA